MSSLFKGLCLLMEPSPRLHSASEMDPALLRAAGLHQCCASQMESARRPWSPECGRAQEAWCLQGERRSPMATPPGHELGWRSPEGNVQHQRSGCWTESGGAADCRRPEGHRQSLRRPELWQPLCTRTHVFGNPHLGSCL